MDDEWRWLSVKSTDDRLRALYLRHYSRKSRRPGYTIPSGLHFIGPGEHMALLTRDGRAGWVWRKSKYRKDGQSGIECSLFRNENSEQGRSSDLIREAVALAGLRWPGERLFTFVNPRKVQSANPGYCFLAAGWKRLKGRTKRQGLIVFEAPSPDP